MHDHSVSIYDYTDHSMLWKKKLLWPNFHHMNHTRKLCHLHRFASHVWCCFPSVLFETPNISNCRISLRVLQGKNARCKGPERDNDWSTWPSKRPRNSNTTSSASLWNLSLWMRNEHSSTMKNTSICFNTMGDFTDLRDTVYILTYIYIHFIHIIYTYVHIYIYIFK